MKAEHLGTNRVQDGILTASWNQPNGGQAAGGELVTLVLKARKATALSEVLQLSSRYTTAEAYNSQNEVLDVALRFGSQTAATQFELYQNTPNPFATNTVIGFHLPQAGNVTLLIQDVTGKVVKVVSGEYAKGYNQIALKREELQATGVLNYTLQSGSFSATKRMVVVE